MICRLCMPDFHHAFVVKPVLPVKEKTLVFDPLDQIKDNDKNYQAYRGG